MRDALIGALVGGLLTLAGDLAIRFLFDHSRFQSMKRALLDEVEAIGAEASTRRGAERAAGVSLQAPLPTDAWRLSLSSGATSKLDTATRSVLFELYRAVEKANHLASQAPLFLSMSISAAGTDAADVAHLLEEKARELATEPHDDVVLLAQKARDLLSR